MKIHLKNSLKREGLNVDVNPCVDRRPPVKMRRWGPFRVLILSLFGVTFLLVPFVLFAQIQFPLDTRMSVCVDPPDPPAMVRSDTDKQNFTNCRRWSDYTPTYRFIEASKFKKCDPKIPIVNQFALHLLEVWGQAHDFVPSTAFLYDQPNKCQLTEVGEKESRSGSMAVWKGSATSSGMVAFVLEDRASGAEQRTNLELLQVIYPSDKLCGELISVDAARLNAWLKTTVQPKFLRAKFPRLFWNHWLRSKKTFEPVDFVTVNHEYRYVVDLSPFQYWRVVKGNETTGFKLPQPSLGDVTIRFYPIGEFSNYDIGEITARAESNRIDKILSTSPAGIKSFAEASANLGTLQTIRDGVAVSSGFGVSYDFSVSKPGCVQIAVLIVERPTRKVVGAWIKSFMAYPEDSDPSSRVEVLGCSDQSGGTQLYNMAIPRFPVPQEENLKAMITYLDIDEHTFAFFEDLRYTPATHYVWKLQMRNLKGQLSQLANRIDDLIVNSGFRLDEARGNLRSFLFSCDGYGKDDELCPGTQAIKVLDEIALEKTSPKPTIKVLFRDLKNNTYFIPFHLVPNRDVTLKDSEDQLRVIQPLPIPPPPRRPNTCVKDWYAGLILKDDPMMDRNWRESWISLVVDKKGEIDLVKLREQYLLVVKGEGSIRPESFIVLAHHSNGIIQDTQKTESLEFICPDHIQRNFGSPSMAILVSCSVGAPGSAHRENNKLIDRLNKNGVQAIIASPFKVPSELAKRFMDHLGDELKVLRTNITVYELFSRVKKRLKEAEPSATSPDTAHLKSIVDSFMLLGSGDVDICKFRDK